MSRPAPPPHYPFYLGGAAATFAGIIVHPADQTKIRAQTQAVRQSMFRTFLASYRRGGVPSLWDGVSATILRQMTYGTARFGVFAQAKEVLLKRRGREGKGTGVLNIGELVACGTFAGAVAGMCGVPFEIVLVRMCSDAIKPPSRQLHYRNALDGFISIWRTEGPRKLYRGASTVVLRSMLMNSSQLASYDVFKRTLVRKTPLEDGPITHIISSFSAGTLSVALCAPVDVIKARIQNSVGESVSFIQVLKKSVREEGLGVLTRGFVPAWTRLIPSTVLTFVILEQLKNCVDLYRGIG